MITTRDIIDIMTKRKYKFRTYGNKSMRLFIRCTDRKYDNMPEYQIILKTDKSAVDFLADIKNIYDNFDISRVTYEHLDEDGHGISPEPYEMIDVYRHYENVRDTIGLYHEILTEIYDDMTRKENKND